MAQKKELFLIPVVLIMGMIAGGMILLFIGTSSGIISFKPAAQVQTTESATPGMDALNNYTCRKAETKQILMGGIEDNYSTADLEPVNFTKTELAELNRSDSLGRFYDEAGHDKDLIDKFEFDGEIAHGFLVLKARSLTDYENDWISVGLISDRQATIGYRFTFKITDIGEINAVERSDDIITLRLLDIKQMRFDDKGIPFSEVVKTIEKDALLRVVVSDDHQVDFMGFALCLKPKTQKGTTFTINERPVKPGFTNVTCGRSHKCDLYGGDKSCKEAFPVVCANPHYQASPDNLAETYETNWSGYAIKYSRAVRGDSFDTADDVHDFCRAEYGDDWRVMGLADMPADILAFGYGDSQKTGRAWINIGDQPYANCWDLRPTYKVDL